MRIQNQWVAGCHTAWCVGSLRPPMTIARKNRHIVRSTLQNRRTLSRTIIREMDESRFCVHHFDGHIRVWSIRGDRSSSAGIRYRHRSPALSVLVWANIAETSCTSLAQIDDNLNADLYITDILLPVVASYR
ncbi:hypothetical protein TNCV_4150171 [Trichonephila clavipes]|uniref:Uncharacterized protein n=1 Tax=Trichonephila clavipes TaxID=2585209 RepID=A0A8X6W6F6_TRICX|nr:hypothetical protein TNCV_4150171 [Trichonephila clavipes]